MLFGCPFVRSVWENVGINEVGSDGYEGNVVDIIQQTFSMCTKDRLALIVMVCWSLWHMRNMWIWDTISVFEFGVREMAMNMLQEWKHSRLDVHRYKVMSTVSARR